MKKSKYVWLGWDGHRTHFSYVYPAIISGYELEICKYQHKIILCNQYNHTNVEKIKMSSNMSFIEM